MFVGKHQRLTGEVKRLPRAVGVIRRRRVGGGIEGDGGNGDECEGEKEGGKEAEELEIVEIVKLKIIFSTRPEPVGTLDGGA